MTSMHEVQVVHQGSVSRSVFAGKEHCITSDHILELDEVPKRLAVIGAGYIGVEFGGIFKNLGSDVEFFLRRDKVLNGFDEEVRCSYSLFMGEEFQQYILQWSACGIHRTAV